MTLKFPVAKRLTASERQQAILFSENACKDAFAMMAATMNMPLAIFNHPAFHHALDAVV